MVRRRHQHRQNARLMARFYKRQRRLLANRATIERVQRLIQLREFLRQRHLNDLEDQLNYRMQRWQGEGL